MTPAHTAAKMRFTYHGETITVDGKTYTAEDLSLVEDTNDTYILYTDAIYATEFDKVFTA